MKRRPHSGVLLVALRLVLAAALLMWTFTLARLDRPTQPDSADVVASQATDR